MKRADLFAVLADGEWAERESVIESCSRFIPSAVAIRRYEQQLERTRRGRGNSDRGLKIPTDERVRMGRRQIITKSICNAQSDGLLEVDGSLLRLTTNGER